MGDSLTYPHSIASCSWLSSPSLGLWDLPATLPWLPCPGPFLAIYKPPPWEYYFSSVSRADKPYLKEISGSQQSHLVHKLTFQVTELASQWSHLQYLSRTTCVGHCHGPTTDPARLCRPTPGATKHLPQFMGYFKDCFLTVGWLKDTDKSKKKGTCAKATPSGFTFWHKTPVRTDHYGRNAFWSQTYHDVQPLQTSDSAISPAWAELIRGPVSLIL